MYNPDSPDELPHHEYAALIRNTLKDAYSNVREHMTAKQEHQKEMYDQKVHEKLYEVGDGCIHQLYHVGSQKSCIILGPAPIRW